LAVVVDDPEAVLVAEPLAELPALEPMDEVDDPPPATVTVVVCPAPEAVDVTVVVLAAPAGAV
jgi:hypothetical protein